MSSAAPEIHVQNGVTVISLGPAYVHIDERLVDGLRESLDLKRDFDPPLVVLDLTNTKFFGSSFIEIMFSLWTRLNTRPGAKFALAGVAPYCKEVLTITHLDTLWQLHPSVADAVKALSKA
jgi:anti-sigma B factor antagonist